MVDESFATVTAENQDDPIPFKYTGKEPLTLHISDSRYTFTPGETKTLPRKYAYIPAARGLSHVLQHVKEGEKRGPGRPSGDNKKTPEGDDK